MVEGGKSSSDEALHGERGSVGIRAVEDDPEITVDRDGVATREDEVDPRMCGHQVGRGSGREIWGDFVQLGDNRDSARQIPQIAPAGAHRELKEREFPPGDPERVGEGFEDTVVSGSLVGDLLAKRGPQSVEVRRRMWGGAGS